ncbi:DoxX family protein [Pontibacter sp. BT310]|uniref:DoxX family protein n=1 Tax=Pontibacter populi TaxID=890055 RepID=A0ABS6XAZ0_9BACT|nr:MULTISPECIES: DoxX family protein [Pontibacter]MBJ6118183.1 DoxX family protein [Pontibacter sp. BT310]MBR0570610.1 DoxX family protein [Microvirga sp. STS03]MBW3365036.1 DoxX family protein [Pontibacter populi]
MTQLSEIRYPRGVNSANNPIWMDGLRVLLGLFLLIKGILFLEHTTDVFRIFGAEQDIVSAGKAHFLTSMVHIVGGLMIMFGMLTRLALLCQIPILLGALLIVNPQRGVNFGNTELILSLIVTGLIVFFMIVGPGRYSVDNKILRPKPNTEEE